MSGAVRRIQAPPQVGFTLIELLLVVVIIGVVLASVRLGLSGLGGERQLDAEAQRLTRLLRLLSDQATLTGADYGLAVDAQGYRFVRHEGTWQPLAGDRLFRPRELPDGMRLWVTAAGAPVPIDAEPGVHSSAPQVLVPANGDFVAQQIEFSHAQLPGVYQLRSDPIHGFVLDRHRATAEP